MRARASSLKVAEVARLYCGCMIRRIERFSTNKARRKLYEPRSVPVAIAAPCGRPSVTPCYEYASLVGGPYCFFDAKARMGLCGDVMNNVDVEVDPLSQALARRFS